MAKNPDLTSTAPDSTEGMDNATNGVDKTPTKRGRKPKCENSVKSSKNDEKMDESHEILADTAQIETEFTDTGSTAPIKEKRYIQKVPNDTVRKKAALEYIEKKTKPKTSPKANGHFPNSDLALKVEPGDNTRYVIFGMAIYNMEPIDINDAVQVHNRINEYFMLCADHDMKPGVANLSMALGIDRQRLLDIVNDAEARSNVPAATRVVIKKAHAYMGSYWESLMQNGKINPASGIFLGKNNFQYRDQTEHVLTPNVKTSDNITPLDLSRRIEALPDD